MNWGPEDSSETPGQEGGKENGNSNDLMRQVIRLHLASETAWVPLAN